MDFMNYINPALLSLVPALYFLGYAIKRSAIPNRKIPFILAGAGIALALIWTMSEPIVNYFAAAFTAIVQGILCAGASVFINQIIQQGSKIK